MKQANKFETGNILYHKPSKSRWIIMAQEDINYKETSFWRLKVKAYCIHHPSANKQDKSCLWQINRSSVFWLQDKDLAEHDKVWKVLYESM
tara:strand:+ start:21 stop:293 length:273 start_codon:yes stop_codon:yes gene_type:complete